MPKILSPVPEQKLVAELMNGVDSDAPKKEKGGESPKCAVRLHPDVIEAIERHAKSTRKKFATALRDLVLEGMKARGIEI